MKQIIVEAMFFDSDDYDVMTEVIPCDSKKTAKKLVKKIYEKILNEDYDFDCEDDPKAARKEWEDEYVTKHSNGSIDIEGSDCGYGWIKIIEKEPVTEDSLSKLKISVGNIY